MLWCLWSRAFPTLAQLSAHLSNTAGFLNVVSSMECVLEPGSLREEVVGPCDGDEAATGQSVAAEHWPSAPLSPGLLMWLCAGLTGVPLDLLCWSCPQEAPCCHPP